MADVRAGTVSTVGDEDMKAPGPSAEPAAIEQDGLLTVERLRAGYGPITAVRDASLTVHSGEIVALVGANGAGKTTLCGGLAGIGPRSEGSITFDGRELLGMSVHERVRSGIALVPEGRWIFTTLTVAENLRLAMRSRREIDAMQGILDLFPILADRLHRPAGGLSGGEQQQLAIGRALLSNPRLLVLDEPTLGLAPLLVGAIFELIVQLRRDRGLAVLVVDQHVHDTLGVADRAYVMRTGELVMEGSGREIAGSDELEAHLLGRDPEQRTP